MWPRRAASLLEWPGGPLNVVVRPWAAQIRVHQNRLEARRASRSCCVAKKNSPSNSVYGNTA